MKIIALVGPSGTGKSYQAISLAKEKGIRYLIDDGLLIKDNRVLGGVSAKGEKTKLAAVKRAIFIEEAHRQEILDLIQREQPPAILMLGTSERMIHLIVEALNLPSIEEWLHIESIASPEEIQVAKDYRRRLGMHIIPVPTFEVKKHFSGYFINPLKVLRMLGRGGKLEIDEKTIVRPTFSYMGRYTISDRVIKQLAQYGARQVPGIHRIYGIELYNYPTGIVLHLDIAVVYGDPIQDLCKGLQHRIKNEIEEMTSLNLLAVQVFVKNIII